MRTIALVLLAAVTAQAGKLDAKVVARQSAALLKAARSNADLGKGALKGDELFDLYLQTALTAAEKGIAAGSAADVEVRGALGALGLFFDDGALRSAIIGKSFAGMETDEQEAAVKKCRGTPTCAGRADSAKHFVLSAAIAAAIGEGVARMAGMTKEMGDMHGLDTGNGSGFSFADLAADEAGVAFAAWLLGDPAARLKKAAVKFAQKSCFPSLEGLPEGLRTDEFDDKYGPVGSENYKKVWKGVEERVAALALYAEEKAEDKAK